MKDTLSFTANMQLLEEGYEFWLVGDIWVETEKTCEKFGARLSMRHGIFVLSREGMPDVKIRMSNPPNPKDLVARFAYNVAEELGGAWVIGYKRAPVGYWFQALHPSPLKQDLICPPELVSA